MTLGERSLAREELREPLVRGREHGLVGEGRPDAVAALDLVLVRPLLAGDHAGVRAEADELVPQPSVLDVGEERVCVGDERGRWGQRLRLDLGRELGRPEVRVDHPVDVPVDPQAESDVPVGDLPIHLGAYARSPGQAPRSAKVTS